MKNLISKISITFIFLLGVQGAFASGPILFSAQVNDALSDRKWCYLTPQPNVYFAADANGNCDGVIVTDRKTIDNLNQCSGGATEVNIRTNSTCSALFSRASSDDANSACDSWQSPGVRNNENRIWCVTSSRTIRGHDIGRCAQNEDGSYRGSPITNCSQYEDGRIALEVDARCLASNSPVVPTEAGSADAYITSCNQYITSLSEQGNTNGRVNAQHCATGRSVRQIQNASECPAPSKVLNGDQYALLAQNGCLGNSNTIVNSDQCNTLASNDLGINLDVPSPGTGVAANQTEVTPTTALENIKCDASGLTLSATPLEEADSLDWNASAYSGAKPILASQSNSGTRRTSRASDDFEDYEDFSASKDFRKAPLLLFCEAHSPEAWSAFSPKLGGAEVDGDSNKLWDGSWKKKFLDLQDLSGQLEKKEIAFIKRCKAQMPTIVSSPQSNTQVQNLVEKLKGVVSEKVASIVKHRKNLERCESLVFLSDMSDYEKEYEGTGRSGLTTKASVDGKVTCKTYGPEAQDFQKCSEFVNAYDASMVAKTALNSGQQIHYQGQNMDRQAELARQGSTGGIDHRGALGSQKADIKDRAGYATQNAALDGAKLAALFGMLQAMPTKAKLIDHCKTSFDSNSDKALARVTHGHKEIIREYFSPFGLDEQAITTLTTAGDDAPSQAEHLGNGGQFLVLGSEAAEDGVCGITARNPAAHTLIMNTEMRSVAKQILAQTAIEAATNLAAAGMLNKQARQIDDLLKRIEGYDPSDDFVAPTTDLMAGPCAFDPSQEGCSGAFSGTDRSVGFGDTSLSFSGGGFGTSGTLLDADNGFQDAGATGAGADRSGAPTTVGSIIPNVDKKSGFQDPAAAAARVKSGKAPSGGAGGGGASAVGSTGNGGGGNSNGQARGGQAAAGRQLAYAGSSIGRLSGGRGVGRKPASKDGAANPFANMFKKGGPGNETLNFRNPAGIGNKAGNIFDQISSRYQVVQTKDRLLEYKEKK